MAPVKYFQLLKLHRLHSPQEIMERKLVWRRRSAGNGGHGEQKLEKAYSNRLQGSWGVSLLDFSANAGDRSETVISADIFRQYFIKYRVRKPIDVETEYTCSREQLMRPLFDKEQYRHGQLRDSHELERLMNSLICTACSL
ncbi:hypothetical protein CBL_05435 [Carabus blaptoides fortunei]